MFLAYLPYTAQEIVLYSGVTLLVWSVLLQLARRAANTRFA